MCISHGGEPVGAECRWTLDDEAISRVIRSCMSNLICGSWVPVREDDVSRSPCFVIVWGLAFLSPAACGKTGGSSPDTLPTEIAADSEIAASPPGCTNGGTPGATSRCLVPVQSPEYYVEQAEKYFDTLDVDADPDSVPNYSALVARWEWPPWLLLTGYTSKDMIATGKSLKALDPSTVPERDCRFFPVQPFARCRVNFVYEEGPCSIYEEFTFNDQGDMTFIEAWSDLPGLLPQQTGDPWGEEPDFSRLSTRIPGLGNETGLIDPESSWMKQTSEEDADVADFTVRAGDWWTWWFDALKRADKDFFAVGCGW